MRVRIRYKREGKELNKRIERLICLSIFEKRKKAFVGGGGGGGDRLEIFAAGVIANVA